MIKRVVVPVDFSTSSLNALDYAIETFREPKSEVILVHVVEPIPYSGMEAMYGGFDISLAYREVERAGRQQLTGVASRLRRRRIAVRPLLLSGSPAHAIVECAKKLKADVIVMSTHGRTGLAHILMGSVAEAVVRYAACPVVTVRGQARNKKTRPRRRTGSMK